MNLEHIAMEIMVEIRPAALTTLCIGESFYSLTPQRRGKIKLTLIHLSLSLSLE